MSTSGLQVGSALLSALFDHSHSQEQCLIAAGEEQCAPLTIQALLPGWRLPQFPLGFCHSLLLVLG